MGARTSMVEVLKQDKKLTYYSECCDDCKENGDCHLQYDGCVALCLKNKKAEE